MFYPPYAFVSITAIRKPANNASPLANPSFLNASGIIDSSNITSMAPAAKAIDIRFLV